MVCKRQEQCVFGEKCIYHIGSVLPKCSIFEQKPPIKQTEQEYIQTCNTEQLAEFLSKIDMPFMDKAPFPCGDLIECNKNCGLYSRCVKDDFPTNKEVWVEWLKQPHTTKE